MNLTGIVYETVKRNKVSQNVVQWRT